MQTAKSWQQAAKEKPSAKQNDHDAFMGIESRNNPSIGK